MILSARRSGGRALSGGTPKKPNFGRLLETHHPSHGNLLQAKQCMSMLEVLEVASGLVLDEAPRRSAAVAAGQELQGIGERLHWACKGPSEMVSKKEHSLPLHGCDVVQPANAPHPTAAPPIEVEPLLPLCCHLIVLSTLNRQILVQSPVLGHGILLTAWSSRLLCTHLSHQVPEDEVPAHQTTRLTALQPIALLLQLQGPPVHTRWWKQWATFVQKNPCRQELWPCSCMWPLHSCNRAVALFYLNCGPTKST